ncbi:hypothetical protein UPYG_G00237010 [Umbra pygmaea]|uniref:Uncharacterized protein n=1 Tax=Umbra pygmaea TaxID=75934 RepID=A0ABD0WEI7_UMBPY
MSIPIMHRLNKENDGSSSAQNPGMFTGILQKVNPFKSTAQTQVRKEGLSGDPVNHQVPVTERLSEAKQEPGMFTGMVKQVNLFRSTAQTQVTNEGLPLNHFFTEKVPEQQQSPGMFNAMMQKINPFKSTPQYQNTLSIHSDLSSGAGSLAKSNMSADQQEAQSSLHLDSSSSDSLNDTLISSTQNPTVWYTGYETIPSTNTEPQTSQEKKKSTGETKLLQRESSSSTDSLFDSTFSTTENQTVWYTDSDTVCSSNTELPAQENKKRTGTGDAQPIAQEGRVEIHTLEMNAGPVPSEGTPLDSDDDVDSLMDWWKTVEGWDTWNESNIFKEDEGQVAVEAVADRVFMAARLFVQLFNQHGCSLQQRVLELLSLADAADSFHKKTVTAKVGGGVASVAGSITTITGLILAPFTMGTSLIVTAVGIGVTTAGGLASASANITDTVHSKIDRKKVEKIIQDYQEEIKDIKECLEFLQVGMKTLEDWDFDQYVESISKKHLNQNVKHVMKEGGRAGKALLINTENLISTVQVLSVAGGAAKAAQVMSVTTGVMSGLFLALDVFFLAKDSIELNKGAKTEFAGKIRDVCKDLQNGLLELNRIKDQLQKTIDGVEMEEEDEED